MPWRETLLMDQRLQFIADYQRDLFDVADLARRFGISRKTAYKWIDRYEAAGPAGLVDRSRRPTHSPNATPAAIVAALVDLRGHHPTWGAKKLRKVLTTREPTWTIPARSTVCDLLDRAGLIPTAIRRPVPAHPGRPLVPMTAPNGTWTADFKGQFKTRNGVYCYPLTIVDGFSRHLRTCQGLLSTAIVEPGRLSCVSSRSAGCRGSSGPTMVSLSPRPRSGVYRRSRRGSQMKVVDLKGPRLRHQLCGRP